jgi:hypothetical protein
LKSCGQALEHARHADRHDVADRERAGIAKRGAAPGRLEIDHGDVVAGALQLERARHADDPGADHGKAARRARRSSIYRRPASTRAISSSSRGAPRRSEPEAGEGSAATGPSSVPPPPTI